MMMMMMMMMMTKLLLIIMTMKQTTMMMMMMILISYWNGVKPILHGHFRRLRWCSFVRFVASSCNKFALQKMKMEEQFGSH